MKFLKKMKDGGAESTVTGYWLVEVKSLFSIVLLKFEGLSRNADHNHAFNSISWVLSGRLLEWRRVSNKLGYTNKGFDYKASIKPIITKREHFHRVDSIGGTTWVLSFRGPWSKTWKEYLPEEDRERTLTHGRLEIG